jgi:hypothetical protein
MALCAIPNVLWEDNVAEGVDRRIGVNLLGMIEIIALVNAMDAPDDRHGTKTAPTV